MLTCIIASRPLYHKRIWKQLKLFSRELKKMQQRGTINFLPRKISPLEVVKILIGLS